RARAAAAWVQLHARSSGDGWSDELPSAEETLERGEGSRTAALLALAQALGLHADLLLARDAGRGVPTQAARNAYSHPLVRFTFAGGHTEVVDAEQDSIAFNRL